MTSATDLIAQVVPESTKLSTSEIDAILEIAYLTIAADRRLQDAEIDAFRGVLERLRAQSVAQSELDRVLDEMYTRAQAARDANGERGYADDRLRELAAKMSAEARELAYKVAYAMSMADMDASDEEFELDLQLVDALEISNERAEDLQGEVMTALNPDEAS